MKSTIRTFLALALVASMAPAQAAVIGLYDYGFNIDGTIALPTQGDPVPAAVDIFAFDEFTGLGALSIVVVGPGTHYAAAFFDHEIDEVINGNFNETGAASGTPVAGQSWEIDEPGFFDGDIFENFQDGMLDRGIGVSIFGDTIFPDDVSMAMGFDFTLAIGEQAVIELVVSEVMPTAGFYLSQTDPDSGNAPTIYLSSTLTIAGVTTVSEPGTLLLLGLALVGAGVCRRRGSVSCASLAARNP